MLWTLLFIYFLHLQLVCGHFDQSTCGTTKKCIFVPAGCEKQGDCKQMFSYNATDDGWVNMEMTSSNDFPQYNYMAVGFSEDENMGDDPVTQCVFTNEGNANVYFSYNVGKSNVRPSSVEDLTAENESLEMIHGHKGDDGMYCHFRQMSTKHNKFAPNLDREYQLFLARGLTSDPKDLGIHSLDPSSPGFPHITESKVNVGSVNKRSVAKELHSVNSMVSIDDNGTESSSPTGTDSATQASLNHQTKFWLVRVHGILMIIAWFAFVTIATFSARYLRDHFTSSAPFGLKWWFHIHRTMNFFALPFIYISTLLIFIAKQWSWRGPSVYKSTSENFTAGSIHSLLGTIAILIAILQPLLALMRCQPDTGARPIFNWTHRSLGIIGIVCAVSTTLIAANSFQSLWRGATWSFIVIIFYIIITLLSVALLEVLSYLKNKAPSKTIAMEMQNRSSHRYDDTGKVINIPPKIINLKPLYGVTMMYVLFTLFCFCVTALLITMLST